MLEEIGVFYRGLVIGVMIAAPVGPIGLLCIRRTIQKGLFIGFATGLGAAFADTLFGAIAAFSVSVILEFMRHYDLIIRMLGVSFLLLGAWHTWHDKPKSAENNPLQLVKKIVGLPKEDRIKGGIRGLLTGFVITMANPVTMFAVLAVVATFGELQTRLDASTIVVGIFSGSALWWALLSGGVALVRGHFTENRIILINRVTAVALTVLALWAVISGVQIFINRAT